MRSLIVGIVLFVLSAPAAVAAIPLAFILTDADAYGQVPIPGSARLHLPAGDVDVTVRTGDSGENIEDISVSFAAPERRRPKRLNATRGDRGAPQDEATRQCRTGAGLGRGSPAGGRLRRRDRRGCRRWCRADAGFRAQHVEQRIRAARSRPGIRSSAHLWPWVRLAASSKAAKELRAGRTSQVRVRTPDAVQQSELKHISALRDSGC